MSEDVHFDEHWLPRAHDQARGAVLRRRGQRMAEPGHGDGSLSRSRTANLLGGTAACRVSQAEARSPMPSEDANRIAADYLRPSRAQGLGFLSITHGSSLTGLCGMSAVIIGNFAITSLSNGSPAGLV